MPDVASPAGSVNGLLERAVALVRLTQGRVAEDILAAAQDAEIDENDASGNSTTVAAHPSPPFALHNVTVAYSVDSQLLTRRKYLTCRWASCSKKAAIVDRSSLTTSCSGGA